MRNYAEVSAYVVLAGTDVGATPLSMAAQEGHADVATALLGHNADPNKARTNGGAGKWTPLFIATLKGHTAIADMLHA